MPALITATPIISNEQWQSLRYRNVGASEVGALFGVHDHITAFALAARKLGKLADQIDDAVLQRGRLLEPVAKKLIAAERPDWELIEPSAYYEDTAIRFGCTPDLFVRDAARGLGIVQIKTVAPPIFAAKWHNDDGAIEPPLWIALQAMSEQHLTGTEFAAVAALVVGYGLSLEIVNVPFVPNVIENVRARVEGFWRLVDAGELPPPDYGRDLANLVDVYRQDDGAELDLTGDNELPELIERYEAMKAQEKAAQAVVEEYKARIFHRIGAAQKVRFAGGHITAKTLHRKAYEVKATDYRPLRISRPRENAA